MLTSLLIDPWFDPRFKQDYHNHTVIMITKIHWNDITKKLSWFYSLKIQSLELLDFLRNL